MLLVFEATVYRHQIHHYRQKQRTPPIVPAILPQATRDTLDQSLLHCVKYLLNYSFYKFGLEVCVSSIPLRNPKEIMHDVSLHLNSGSVPQDSTN